MSLLGASLAGQGADESLAPEARLAKLREAEPMLLNGYNGMKDDPRVPSPAQLGGADRKREALMRVVALYEAWDRVEPGRGYGEKAAEWRSQDGADPGS